MMIVRPRRRLPWLVASLVITCAMAGCASILGLDKVDAFDDLDGSGQDGESGATDHAVVDGSDAANDVDGATPDAGPCSFVVKIDFEKADDAGSYTAVG